MSYDAFALNEAERKTEMTNADDLTLRNDVTGALIAGGHWHGGGNEEICATIAHLCKAANERDAFCAQNAALEAELAKVREVASENFKYLEDRVSALHDKNAALAAALKPFADFFEGDLTNVGGGTEAAPTFKIQNFKDAKAAIAAAEGSAE